MSVKKSKPKGNPNFKGSGKGMQHPHEMPRQKAQADQAPRNSRQQANPTPKALKPKAGPGRPKGSTLDPQWRLTPNQMRIAEAMLDKELEDGIFPASVKDVSQLTGADPAYVRKLLKRKEFQDYLFELLKLEGVILEGAFWRGMALGLSVGDVKVLELYAKMTGKVVQKQEARLEITLKSPEGRALLPEYVDVEALEVIDET